MSVAERNFQDFHLGDDVYQLADGLIPEIAVRLDFKLATEPNSEELYQVVGKLGQNKVLRENAEVTAIGSRDAAGLVEASGVQEGLDRSLWTPRINTDWSRVDAIVATGAVPNWQDRVATRIKDIDWLGNHMVPSTPIYLAAGSRTMDTATERTNHNVDEFFRTFDRYPTESEYSASYVLPEVQTHFPKTAVATAFPETSGDQLPASFFEANPTLLEKRIAFVRVANAGVQLAVQMRKAAQALKPDFDTNPDEPQVYVITDSFPLALSEEQEGQPQTYQKPMTALRQVILTAKMLHEAAGGQ